MSTIISAVVWGNFVLPAFANFESTEQVGVREIHSDQDWEPLRAAGLSAFGVPVAALALAFLGFATNDPGTNGLVMQFVPLTPMMSGLGQWYAGDKPRAVAVGAGMVVCMYASNRLFTNTVFFDGTGSPYNTGFDDRTMLVFIGYSVFAAWDAYRTMEIMQKRRSSEPKL